MNTKFLILTWFALIVGSAVFSQEKPGMAKLDQDFKFKDGIFLDFNQVKNNSPIPKARILTTVPYNDRAFFDKVFEQDIISYFDDHGVRRQLKKENVWGYAKNGTLYIQLDNNFNRISIVGGICHFIGMITTYDTRYVDPYYRFNYPYSYRYYPGYYPTQTYTKTEMRQFILDFETGKVMEYTKESIEMALMRDPQLYDEYVQLRNKKKKQLKFLYLRKFNERNPVFIPTEEDSGLQSKSCDLNDNNAMRKMMIVLLFACLPTWLMAQAPFPDSRQIDEFMHSKTLVVLEGGIFSTFNAVIKPAMKENWTITPYEYIDYDTFMERKSDPAYSFLILTETGFEGDKSSATYNFLNLLLGDSVNNISRMPELCSFPLSYTKVDDPEYTGILPVIIKFMQQHVQQMTTLSNPNALKHLRYYNKNMPHLRNITLWLPKKDLTEDINTKEKISKVYDYPMKIVSQEELIGALAHPSEPFAFLFKVGPEGSYKTGRVYKIILDTTGKMYFFNIHQLSAKRPDGLLFEDIKRLGR